MQEKQKVLEGYILLKKVNFSSLVMKTTMLKLELD